MTRMLIDCRSWGEKKKKHFQGPIGQQNNEDESHRGSTKRREKKANIKKMDTAERNGFSCGQKHNIKERDAWMEGG